MTETILVRDDFVPYLDHLGVAARLDMLASENVPMVDLICHLKVWAWELGVRLDGLDGYQVEHLVADLALANKLEIASLVEGGAWPGVARASAPSGIGIGSGNVWANPPGETYVLRFYTNGELKTKLTDYYITSLESIGASSGDTVQICQVVDGVVGWWTSKTVP